MTSVVVNPIGLAAAAAATTGLSAQAAGHTAQAAAAAAVVPPGMEEISATNAAKIVAYSAEVTSVLSGASAMQAMYGVANSVAGTVMSLEDAANAVLMNAVL
ncbi:PE domain-containing protein [Mycobacterium neglectum]|uniref:PE domain-containing protein n=1 Tax=Mycobacterium neglectum TaxID=242737 RepID=UPI000BFF0C49|nr:PE domain-containing protein [Mycobacterium neglectum]